MLRDILFFAFIILLALVAFILLMRRRRHKNSLPTDDQESPVVRITRHLDDV